MVDITDEVIADFRRFCPAFSDFNEWPSQVIEQRLIEGDCETGAEAWGLYRPGDGRSTKRSGMFYYAAHQLASFYGESANDPTDIESSARLNIASKSIGDESVSYRISAIENTSEDYLSTTVYGVNFVRLRRRIFPLPMAI